MMNVKRDQFADVAETRHKVLLQSTLLVVIRCSKYHLIKLFVQAARVNRITELLYRRYSEIDRRSTNDAASNGDIHLHKSSL